MILITNWHLFIIYFFFLSFSPFFLSNSENSPSNINCILNNAVASAALTNNNNNNVLNNNNLNGSSETLCPNRGEQPDPDFIKMFVGQVPKSMDEEQLREMFEEFGRVHSINVLRDKVTGVSKGNLIKFGKKFYPLKNLRNSNLPRRLPPFLLYHIKNSILYIDSFFHWFSCAFLLFSFFENQKQIQIKRNTIQRNLECIIIHIPNSRARLFYNDSTTIIIIMSQAIITCLVCSDIINDSAIFHYWTSNTWGEWNAK